MPMPIQLAHSLAKRLTAVRKDGTLGYLRPDGKTQVTIEYEGNRPVRVHTVVVSTQHAEDVSVDQIREDLIKHVIVPIIPADFLDDDTIIYVNPTGRFVVGGPMGDSGLTGRKIIVDTYGGYSRHGGGAFSGKDPTKVDRTAAYAARYLAKNVVAPDLPTSARSRLHMLSALLSPYRFSLIHSVPRMFRTRSCTTALCAALTCVPRLLSSVSISADRYISSLPHTAIWDARMFAHRGRTSISPLR